MERTQNRPIVFGHRRNSDATIDSICRSCFLVVGRAFKKGDLEYMELTGTSVRQLSGVSPFELFTESSLTMIKE